MASAQGKWLDVIDLEIVGGVAFAACPGPEGTALLVTEHDLIAGGQRDVASAGLWFGRFPLLGCLVFQEEPDQFVEHVFDGGAGVFAADDGAGLFEGFELLDAQAGAEGNAFLDGVIDGLFDALFYGTGCLCCQHGRFGLLPPGGRFPSVSWTSGVPAPRPVRPRDGSCR